MRPNVSTLSSNIDVLLNALRTTHHNLARVIVDHQKVMREQGEQYMGMSLFPLAKPFICPVTTEQMLFNTIHNAGAQAATAVIVLTAEFAKDFSRYSQTTEVDCETVIDTRRELDAILVTAGKALQEYSSADPRSALERIKAATLRAHKSPLTNLGDLVHMWSVHPRRC